MKTLIITHIDMDGSGVAIMYKLFRPDADIIYVNYGWETEPENIRKLDQYDELLIGDISFSPEFATILDKSSKTVILCDHHRSAIDKFEDAGSVYDWMHLDDSRCGTLLVYDLISTLDNDFEKYSKYKELAVLIDDYDRWVHNDSRSIDLNFLHNKLGQEGFVERFLSNPLVVFSSDELDIISENKLALEESINTARNSMNSTHYIDCDGLKFNYCNNVPCFLSLVATALLREFTELDYLVLYEGYDSISFRSQSVHINKIAESLGGGGHTLAAGAPYNVMMDVVNSVINRKPMNYEFYESLPAKFNKVN